MADFEHVDVYREDGIFAGWPANHGMWRLGGRVIVGFQIGELTYNNVVFHAVARMSPVVPMMAETLDEGLTWMAYHPVGPVELLPHHGVLSSRRQSQIEESMVPLRQPVDFHSVLVKFRMTGVSRGRSYMCVSEDGYTWNGPYVLPLFGRAGMSARTSYLVDEQDSSRCLAFWSAAKLSDEWEGQPLCAETRDGGVSWELISWIDEPPMRGFGIMPSAVRFPGGRLVCCVRWRERSLAGKYGRQSDPFGTGIICYESVDEGRTWDLISVPVRGMGQAGNPPDLVLMPDGRLVLVYGWRDGPYSIVYQVSKDRGRSWSEPDTVRDGGGCHDLGYSRSFVRSDGRVCSVYYWNDSPDSERYIAATVWECPAGVEA